MQIQTSYYAKSARHPGAISISRGKPRWFEGPQLLHLAPTWQMMRMTEDQYVNHFVGMLQSLDPHQIVESIRKLLPPDQDTAVLLCYEKPTDFCHRFLVSRWLNDAGYDVTERV